MSKLVKKLTDKYFGYFSYFYTYLRHRIFISLILSLMVGVLDGFGLAMFLPLLQMVDGESNGNVEGLGNLHFLIEGIKGLGLELTIVTVLLVMLFFFLLKGVAKFGQAFYNVIVRQYFVKKLRFANVDKLSGYSYKSFVKADSGRIQNTLSGEIERVVSAYKNYFLTVQSAVLVSIYIFLAFLSNPQFAALVTFGGLLSNIAYQYLYKKTKEISRKITLEHHVFQGLVIQKVAFFKYLKATGSINKYANKLKKTIVDIEKSTRKIGLYSAILTGTREPFVMLVVVLVILVQITYFGESLGLILLSLLFFYRSLTFLMALQTQWNSFLNVSGSLENMTDFMKELSANQERIGLAKAHRLEKEIEIRGVSFFYDNTKTLDNIDLTIRKNETVAFVGESGSGKTTLVNLIAGLMPIDQGDILVDGISYKTIDMNTYQQRIGYITQEPVIFSDNIFNNVTFWDDPSDENISRFWRALRKAAIYDFVQEIPEKERAMLGNNGILVSGGQKQRLSIARELYKEVDILIMDEATSALDSETEKAIQQNIDDLKGEYTILIVAHRLATVKNSDKIVLLNKGKIENSGPFGKLRYSSEAFRRMVELQEF